MVGVTSIRTVSRMIAGAHAGWRPKEFRVIRIAAHDVRDELEGVLSFIARVVRERIADFSAAPSTTRAKSPGRSPSPPSVER